ncbi:hypothetical protein GQ457_09G018470 [Hibiscus cannabinus]
MIAWIITSCNLVLKQERKEYVIEEAVPNDPGANAPRADKYKFKKHMDDMLDVGCLMLATMTPELQKQHEDMLGFALNDELAIDVVLQSLPDSFNQFILNYNMNEIEKTLPQLLGMLRTAEGNMKKGGSKSVLMVCEAKGKGKKVAKSKGIGKTKPKGKEALKPNGGVSKDGKSFYCGKTGHWKTNCSIYLEDMKKAKAVGASVVALAQKSEELEKFKEFKNEVQNQHGKSIKTLRSDRGGEYLSQDFDELLKEYGIVSQLTPPGTPQWNGVSERRNRTLLDMVRSMMSHTDLPTSFWGYALETTAFTLNSVPSKSVQETPHEMWNGKCPNMSFMKVWGCKAYVKHQMSTKLETKSQKCTFVGYPKEIKGYYFYNENKVFVARTGVFLEKEFLSNKGKGRNIELKEVQKQQVHEPKVEESPQIVKENSTDLETQPLRRSTREHHEPERYGFLK